MTGTSKSSDSIQSVRLEAPESPRIALVLDVAEHEAGLGRELGLHQHLVAAHVDDGVDVLDVHRALLDAGAAGRARPQHVGVDHGCRPGSPPRRRRPGCVCMHPVGVGEHVVAQIHDEELRRQRLAGVPGRALRLAPPALGAGGHVEELLPREVLDAAGAEDHLVVVADVLHGHVGGGGQGAQGPGPPGRGHVDRGQEDVQVLRVGDEDQEAHDDGDVEQERRRLDDAVDCRCRAGRGHAATVWEAKAHWP